MGKKKMMKFAFLTKTSEKWRPWPSCAMSGHLKTQSFRGDGDNGIFKILNSAYNLDSTGDHDSSSVNSGKGGGCLSMASYEQLGSDCVEKVIRGLRSERLVFKPEETSSMVVESAAGGGGGGEKFPLKESVAMAMDSTDPIMDFKRSMEEMVEAHDGVKDWEFLEELLICYLRINGKSTHGYIVGAFVDLLVGLSIDAAAATDAETTAAATTVASSSSSSSSGDEHCLLSSSTIDHNSFTSQFSFTSSATCSTGPYFSLQEKSHEDEIMEKSASIDHASSSSSSHLS
ncbi:PREDICTED: transcription repressor OFP13-like [Ipomoea nil]|uniref:transcription repressor OFP13-like n=1 Tax=Ipomoea nil TaxID=35883 RepID=UPI0009015994|nr:PREDICTED: transcription repressor OFP13-like [Ipomoea nil]